MKPPAKNKFTIKLGDVTKNNQLRFGVVITTPEGYEFILNGALAGVRAETSKTYAQMFINWSRPVRWNETFEADVIALLMKKGVFKRLAKVKFPKGPQEEVSW